MELGTVDLMIGGCKRLGLFLIAAGLVSGILSGCGTSANPSALAKTGEQAGTSASVEPTVTGTTFSGQSSSVADIPECSFVHLRVALGDVFSGTGHTGVVLHFRNTSPSACRLAGYPSIVLGKDLTFTSRAKDRKSGFFGGISHGDSVPVVFVGPNGSASSMVEGTSSPRSGIGRCPADNALRISLALPR